MYRSRCEQFKKAREAVKRAEAALAAFNASSGAAMTAGGGGDKDKSGGGEKTQGTVTRSESTASGTGISIRGTNRERRAAIPSAMNLSSISESMGGSMQADVIERDPPSTTGAAASNADGSNGSGPKSEGSSKEGGGLSYGSVLSQLQGLISGASTKPDVKLERRRKEEDEALHKVC